MTQLNTPYPSTAYLTGFLQSRGIEAEQADLGIEMVLRLFSPEGIRTVFRQLHGQEGSLPKEAISMMRDEQTYVKMIGPVVAFLQGKTPKIAARLIEPGLLPQGPRFR
ncbi:MAG TPA: hypothetical protein VFU48_06970 [Nitrospira sp.]|nr:hypothetical protein [Nitrospira sp.]